MAKSNTAELMEALTLLAKEKGIEAEVLVEKIQAALVIAIKKDYPRSENINFDIDLAKGRFDVAIMKNVVETVEDPANEIALEDARAVSKRLNVGDMCPLKLDTKHFGRIAAQTAKQVIKQGIKEVEREQLVAQWGGLQNEAISAEVKKIETDSLNALVSVNGSEVMLFRNDQIPGEVLHEGDIVKVFVSGVSSDDRRPTLRVSRTHRDLIRRLFELEVPEIADGTVEIKSISREAGSRSKVAVISNNENVDALGACIGPQRGRITKICEELCGEKIDVVKYSDDPKEYIKQALKPANVISVDIPDEEVRACSVVVPDNQLSLAIGNKGQNAKLAARLTGFKIDIKPESGFFEG
ncbi:MAG TPA: transcription termination/antitermination protein NusA [Ruminococcaceae bacterium]|nr:transcription termination/antitermination protein NusA [Oscillospiraceae bacterium]